MKDFSSLKNNIMEQYKIVTSRDAGSLTTKINELIVEGWERIGSHQVVEKHHQLRYAGMQHKDTTIELEYSQTMIKK